MLPEQRVQVRPNPTTRESRRAAKLQVQRGLWMGDDAGVSWPSVWLPAAFFIGVYAVQAAIVVPGADLIVGMSLAVGLVVGGVAYLSVRGRDLSKLPKKHPLDGVVVLTFVVFAVIALFVDLVQAGHGPGRIATANSYAPRLLKEGFDEWVANCDPLLGANPPWYWFISVLSPLMYLPFYLVGIWVFLTRTNSATFHKVALMWSALLCLTTVAVVLEEVWGELASPNVPRMLGGYLPYVICPILVGWRCWKFPLFEK